MLHRRGPLVTFGHASGAVVVTLPEAFGETVSMRPDAIALCTQDGDRALTWADYDGEVRRIAAGLAALLRGWGETIGLLLTNRIEFHLVDTAALHLGATPFSIYATLPAARIAEICANAGNRILVTERQFLNVVWDTGIAFACVICVDGPASGAVDLADVMRNPLPHFDFDAIRRQVRPEDLATIVYTSGTTGAPKGVELTHANILAQLAALAVELPTGGGDRIISYLPAAHIADRVTAHYANIARGMRVVPIADPHRFADALVAVRPTVVFGVPRVWHKAQAAIEGAVAADPRRLRRRMARWALGVGVRAARAERGRGCGPLLRLRYRIAETLVLARIRRRIGLDEVRFAASGAAPISAEVLEFFHGLGIRLTEVWGLSEAAGVSTATTVTEPALGSVGKAVPGTELALAADGEIMLRGPMVMRGYRRDPGRTAATFTPGGWLLTGDLGMLDPDGNLRIIGRKSEMIINDSGKNIAPALIENAVRAASFLIGHVVVVGEGRPYLVALITLDGDAIGSDARTQGVVAADVAELVRRAGVRERVVAAVRSANATVSRPERIKRFVLLDHVWQPGSDELTPKMSVRRAAVERNYADVIEDLYADAPTGDVQDTVDPTPRRPEPVRRRRMTR
ncbi:long-chain fatty acid--CoA ligase [Nocardia sp. BMG111209]|uniref:AMP-dependent synthetase/ligase n=1 Tax=Nocardia sp. BMG111209 TaxID=1160137 RepID=UPI00035C8C01|nr:long-chain fatty acid--CoA ligase [Nocardia sp. BMG111209]